MTFEEIINESCDIIDDALFPDCEGKEDIMIKLDETCNNEIGKINITYLNCKTNGNEQFLKTLPCTYIPFKSSFGLILLLLSLFSIFIEVYFGIVIIM